MPFSWHITVNSALSFWKISSIAKCDRSGCRLPASSLEMAISVEINSSAAPRESSRWPRVSASSPSGCFCDKAEEKRRAALSGCNKSWLAAAKKRVLLWLAWSATVLAVVSWLLATDSSLVRSLTRDSRVSLVSLRAFSVRLYSVISK